MENEGRSRLLAAALRRARLGRPVFPCNARKRPLTARGFCDASSDPERVRAWWSQWPDALIGMPTGAASGLVVLDLDRKDGLDGVGAFCALRAGREAPVGLMVRTRSGGLHFYMRAPEGRRVPCSAGRLAPGVDVRGDGGYVIVPPSPGYAVAGRAPPALPPGWLFDLFDRPASPKVLPEPGGLEGRLCRRLAGLVRVAARAAEGRRNAVLFWAACRLGEAVAKGLLGEVAAVAMAQEAGLIAGLPAAEARRTALSGIRTGMGSAHA